MPALSARNRLLTLLTTGATFLGIALALRLTPGSAIQRSDAQHQPIPTDEGKILLFDNRGTTLWEVIRLPRQPLAELIPPQLATRPSARSRIRLIMGVEAKPTREEMQ